MGLFLVPDKATTVIIVVVKNMIKRKLKVGWDQARLEQWLRHDLFKLWTSCACWCGCSLVCTSHMQKGLKSKKVLCNIYATKSVMMCVLLLLVVTFLLFLFINYLILNFSCVILLLVIVLFLSGPFLSHLLTESFNILRRTVGIYYDTQQPGTRTSVLWSLDHTKWQALSYSD